MKRFMHCTALAALLLAASPSSAQSPSSVEGFYKDKKVRMLVGYGVGTGNDLNHGGWGIVNAADHYRW